MAEPSFEGEAIKSLYSKMSQHHLARGDSVIQQLTGIHSNKLSSSPMDNMADVLGQQASGLTEADSILGGLNNKKRFSSRGEHAAHVERGIQDKMKAMGMLDRATNVSEAGAPMMADYVDPVTGEVVNADTFDQVGANALGRANEQAFQAADIDNPFSYLDRDLNEDTFWEDAFGAEAGAAMRESANKGIIDAAEVFGGLKNFQNTMNRDVKEMSMSAINDERVLRAEAARAQAESFNNQEAVARNKSDALAAEAAKSKINIRKSITEDKQNLARQSHGGIDDGPKKARIDYGSDSNRPI